MQAVLNLDSRPPMGFQGKSPMKNATGNCVYFCLYQQTSIKSVFRFLLMDKRITVISSHFN